jgi:hypothetical protein
MAQFPKIQLTRLGKNMIIDGQNKKPVAFTKVELGDGLLSGQSVEELTALVHSVMSVPLQNFTNNGDGTAHLRFVLDNNDLDKGFFNREIGVYAKVGDGTEQLYAYTNAGNLADYIPGKESPISSKIINLHIIVGNAVNLTIVAENSAYATKLDMDGHKTQEVLDHPDGSVTTPKIRDEAVTGAKIAQASIEKKHLKKGGISAEDVGAYSKGETDEKITAHRTAAELDHPEKSVRKKHLHPDAYESPAFTGTPTAPTAGKGTNNGQIASTAFVAQAIAALVNSAPGALDTLQELAQALGNDANFSTTVTNALAGKVSKSGDTMTGPLNVPILDVRSGFFGDYKRDSGDAIDGNGGANVNVGSWYGIGFYDTYNKKYTGSMDLRAGYWRTLGKIRADQGFVGDLAGTADNANKLGGQSLQWIINQINAAKTGIVAGNLAQNGWVKFANGLILQWGLSQKAYDSYVAFPVSYPQQCFCVQVSSRWLNRRNPYECFSLPYDIKASGFSFRMDGGDNQVLWLAIGI